MTESDYIIEVNETNFDNQVIAYSFQYPVVVDFWAEWCGPCRIIGPVLEKLAEEAHGNFRLAKVNVDNNPNLAVRFAVRSIPVVKAFKDGKVISEFVGAQPEPRVREFIHTLSPSAADLALIKGQSMFEKKQWRDAEQTFKQILGDSPTNAPALLGIAKSLLMQDRAGEAQAILSDFPPSKEFLIAEILRPVAAALVQLINGGFTDEDPLDAAFHQALRLVRRGNLPAAIDGLLDVIRQNKKYRNGEARIVILGLFELMGENDQLTRQYRQELATVLF